ncbi:MAG: hypothetical protein CMH53_08865 [Myxococcales bacterium]|nr:hypothetical protein [Myxococcales bacterium]
MQATKNKHGFTLMELMIVVVIVSILATVAVTSYKQFSRRARVQEAIAFLGDVRIKQSFYYQTYRRYVSSGTSFTDWWPKAMKWTEASAPWGINCAKEGDISAHPGWCALGAGFSATQEVQFQYVVWARDPTSPKAPPTGYIQDPDQDWWIARARADFNQNGKFSDIWLSSERREPVLQDETE